MSELLGQVAPDAAAEFIRPVALDGIWLPRHTRTPRRHLAYKTPGPFVSTKIEHQAAAKAYTQYFV